MLATLLTIYLLGGSTGASGFLFDFGDLKKQVKEFVTDEYRQADALDTVKDMKSLTKQYGKQVKSATDELVDVFAAREPDEAMVNQVFDAFIEDFEEYTEDGIELRFELRDTLTEEEWSAVHAADESDSG